MFPFSWLWGSKRQATPAGRPARRPVRAKYDAATHHPDSARHWAAADSLSPDGANSEPVRQTLRIRSRYEYSNNTYCKGIVCTLANDVVGTGPSLQMLTEDRGGNDTIEKAFALWAREIGLAEKLRTMKQAKSVDGEAFAVLITNPQLKGPVKLDLRPVEADCVQTPPSRLMANDDAVDGTHDGIDYDKAGNPIAYWVSKFHPGDGGLVEESFTRVPAHLVIHWFHADRPGQSRGVPEITPALPLFAQLRRYTLAVIAAAETAADFAAVLETESVDGEGGAVGDPFEALEIEKRMMVTLPVGNKLKQLEAEQPTTTYPQFKAEILNEIARCLSMPYNVAAGNSSTYNYASGRLDHQTYHKSIGVEQDDLERVALDRLFLAWVEEADLVAGTVPTDMGLYGEWPHQWIWPGWEHVDPLKEASAQTAKLANNTTTLAEEYAKRGLDWESQIRQRAREVALMKELKLAAAPPTKPAPQPTPAPGEEPEEEEAEEEPEEVEDE